jgi:hypothetical protein
MSTYRFVRFLILLGLLAALLLAFTFSLEPNTNWATEDLRLLDAPEKLPPAADVLAIYTHPEQIGWRIRLDFLDLSSNHTPEIHIIIKCWSSKKNQQNTSRILPIFDEYSLIIGQDQKTLNNSNKFLSNLKSDTKLDQFETSIIPPCAKGLPQYTPQLLIETFWEGQKADQLGPFNLDVPSQIRGAPYLLAFWDVLPAETPAQLIRYWDGAHNGPYGQRQGLVHLLKALEKTHLPAILLDLKTPETLSALQELGQTNRIQFLQQRGQLLLPENVISSPLTHQLASLSNVNLAKQGLSLSPFCYGALSGPEPQCHFIFTRASFSFLTQYAQTRFIPLPSEESSVDLKGLTLTAKQALHQAAFAPQGHLLTLGGSLRTSAWADSKLANEVLTYLANRPWLKPLDQYDLATYPIHQQAAFLPENCLNVLCQLPAPTVPAPTLLSNVNTPDWPEILLKSLPDSEITVQAFFYYQRLKQPALQKEEGLLRQNYYRHLERLILAASWAAAPDEQNMCFPKEHPTECLLSNKNLFIMVALDSGRISLAARRSNTGSSLWLVPTYPFSKPVSDPSEWLLEKGENADPQTISGAFDGPIFSTPYTVNTVNNGLTLLAPDQSIQKSFILKNNSLHFEGVFSNPQTFNILFYTASLPGQTKIFTNPTQPAQSCPAINQTGVKTPFRLASPQNLQPWFGVSENPNQEYPDGYLLPFPLEIIKINTSQKFSMEFNFDTTFCKN